MIVKIPVQKPKTLYIRSIGILPYPVSFNPIIMKYSEKVNKCLYLKQLEQLKIKKEVNFNFFFVKPLLVTKDCLVRARVTTFNDVISFY